MQQYSLLSVGDFCVGWVFTWCEHEWEYLSVLVGCGRGGRRRNLECLNNVHVYIMMASGGVTRTQSQAELTPARVGLLLVYPHFHALVLYWWTSHCHARASWWLGEVTTYLVNQHSSNNLHHESVKLHWEMYTCTFYASMHLVRTMLQKLFFRAAIMTPRSFNVELNVY